MGGLQAAKGERREAEQLGDPLEISQLIAGHDPIGAGDVKQTVQHVLKQLRAAAVALAQPPRIALKTPGGLAGQLIKAPHIAFAAGVGLEDQREGVILSGLSLAVGLGQLGAKRRHRRGERRIFARQTGGTELALRFIDPAHREAGNFAPEAHFAMAMPYDRDGRVTITRRG